MLVGVVDPSHREMARDTVGRLPEWLSLADALEASRDGKWSPWPWELLNAMFSEYQHRGDRITTSSLVDHCVRADIIKRKADYVEDLESLYIPFRGTAQHYVLEHYSHPESIAEARFFTTVDGDVVISCSPDHLSRTTLTDYKMTENPPRYQYPWANHTEQVQFNAYIVRHAEVFQLSHRKDQHDIDVDLHLLPFDPREDVASRLAVVYLGPKFVKTLMVEGRVEEHFDIVAGKKVKSKGDAVWSDAKVEDLLLPRVEMFKAGLEAYPEWPDGAEKVWGGEAGWSCPGYPLCKLPNCLAKRWPDRLTW